ncbi:MAG: carboxypeptidase-like regulatory domain-containing protein, partial [Chitinophagaceae bacterium]
MLLTQFSILLKKAVFIFVFLLSAIYSFAQNGTVTGTVKDAAGASLSNASVTVQGSGRGTTTNAEGMF